MNIFILVIVIIMAVFATLSIRRELHNYRSGNKRARAKRRIIIGICLLIEAVTLLLGFATFFALPYHFELLFWAFALLLMIPIIWLAWIDLKANLRDIEKSAVEDIRKIIHEIKKDTKHDNKYPN